ncbi:MAG TPA: ribosome maturation factor RimM [Chthonomonadaceae bacterium]|nr:ribosome maturation factor RimM [Chthonomonadaceae bacterium]
MSYEDWSLTVGEVVAPFGRIGEVKVRLETDFPDRFGRLSQVCLRWPNGEARLYTVENARLHKGQILLKLRGVADINEAEKLRNALVQVRTQDAVSLPTNEFYIHDLIGCEVMTAEGRILGPVTSVLQGRANDVFVVGQGRQEILLPAIKEVVRTIDLPNRRIIVTPTPGLLPGEAEEA